MNYRFYILCLIFALSLAPYFIKLGASSLWDANEAFYAETPREMLEAGDFINPSFNYQPRFNKPPLCYWIVAGFYKLFGVSEMSERLPLAFGAMLMVMTAFFLGRAAYSTEAGLLAAIALATLPRFVMFSRRIMIDVYIAMFMGLTLLFFALAEKYPDKRRRFLALMYLSIGLGVMTKGPVAIALPALAFLIYFAATRQLGKLRRMMLIGGAAIVAAIVLPWYAAVYTQHGIGYIESFLLQDNLSRYTQPIWGPRRGFFFYIPVLLGDLFPWSLLLFLVMVALVAPWVDYLYQKLKRRQQKRQDHDSPLFVSNGQHHQTLLFLIWALTIVGFYSLSRNKEDLYISPIYTAAAALVGVGLARFLDGKTINEPPALAARSWDFGRFVPAILPTIGLLVAFIGAALFYLFGRPTLDYQLSGAAAIGIIAIGGGATVAVTSFLKRHFTALAALALTFVSINTVFVFRTLPDFERFKPIRPFCEVIAAKADSDALIGYYKIAAPSMVFYLRRQIFEIYNEEELLAAFASGREVYCVMSQSEYEAIKARLPLPIVILASRPIFQVKLRGILDRRELPQVVLITNTME